MHKEDLRELLVVEVTNVVARVGELAVAGRVPVANVVGIVLGLVFKIEVLVVEVVGVVGDAGIEGVEGLVGVASVVGVALVVGVVVVVGGLEVVFIDVLNAEVGGVAGAVFVAGGEVATGVVGCGFEPGWKTLSALMDQYALEKALPLLATKSSQVSALGAHPPCVQTPPAQSPQNVVSNTIC